MIIDEVTEIFGEIIDLTGIKIDSNSVLGDDIPIDSRDMMRILSRIESRYRFRFDPNEILSLKKLADILQVIQQKTCNTH